MSVTVLNAWNKHQNNWVGASVYLPCASDTLLDGTTPWTTGDRTALTPAKWKCPYLGVGAGKYNHFIAPRAKIQWFLGFNYIDGAFRQCVQRVSTKSSLFPNCYLISSRSHAWFPNCFLFKICMFPSSQSWPLRTGAWRREYPFILMWIAKQGSLLPFLNTKGGTSSSADSVHLQMPPYGSWKTSCTDDSLHM